MLKNRAEMVSNKFENTLTLHPAGYHPIKMKSIMYSDKSTFLMNNDAINTIN